MRRVKSSVTKHFRVVCPRTVTFTNQILPIWSEARSNSGGEMLAHEWLNPKCSWQLFLVMEHQTYAILTVMGKNRMFDGVYKLVLLKLYLFEKRLIDEICFSLWFEVVHHSCEPLLYCYLTTTLHIYPWTCSKTVVIHGKIHERV